MRVRFVCLHNAGRSQMSQALFQPAAHGAHHARSAGTTPADRVHPEVIEVMADSSSRRAASSGVSPASILPPGSAHWPACRFIRNARRPGRKAAPPATPTMWSSTRRPRSRQSPETIDSSMCSGATGPLLERSVSLSTSTTATAAWRRPSSGCPRRSWASRFAPTPARRLLSNGIMVCSEATGLAL